MSQELVPQENHQSITFGSFADGISSAGLLLSVIGAVKLDTTGGVICYGVGRGLDLADGYFARRFTSSEYGPKVDAVFDKLAVAAGLGGAIYYGVVPEVVLATIALHNVVNAVTNVSLDLRGFDAGTDQSGKLGMFGHNLTFGAFALSSATGNTSLELMGWGLLAASEPHAVEASIQYSKKALNARKQTKMHHKQRR